jgi:hypothetical protein
LTQRMAGLGSVRSRQFSWKAHVQQIINLAGTLPRDPQQAAVS